MRSLTNVSIQSFIAKAAAKYPVLASRVPRFMPMFNAEIEDGVDKKAIEGTLKLLSQLFPKEPNFLWAVKAYRGAMKKRLGSSTEETKKQESDWNFIRSHQQDFKHFALNAREHGYQSVIDFVIKPTMSAKDFHAQLKSLEEAEELKKEDDGAHRVIEPDLDTQETFLKLPGGWEWVLLDRGYCSQEKNAMGHCGNAGARDGDQILSLREPVKGGKQRPHLTFILNKGILGEMKGYKNNKPSAKFHKHIVALLKDPRIEAILGGGYKPQNNFHLSDLTESEREEVLKVNPDIDFKDWAKKNPKEFERQYGYKLEGDHVILFTYKSIYDFANEESRELKNYLDLLEDGLVDFHSQYSTHDLVYFFDDVAEHKDFAEVVAKIKESDLEEYADHESLDIDQVKKDFEKSPYNVIKEMIGLHILEDLEHRLAWAMDDALRQAYESEGWKEVKKYFFDQDGPIYFGMDDPAWIDGEVKIVTSLNDFQFGDDMEIPKFRPWDVDGHSYDSKNAVEIFYDYHVHEL